MTRTSDALDVVVHLLKERLPPPSATCEGSQVDFPGFQRRLKTFTSSRWLAISIDPRHLAAYGWESTSEGLLRCETCGEIWKLVLPDLHSDTGLYSACHKKALEMIEHSAHKPCCLWASCPCLKSFLSLPQTAVDATVTELEVNRLLSSSSAKMLPEVPEICDASLVQDMNDTQIERLEQFKRSFLERYQCEKQVRNAVLLVLSGWRLNEKNNGLMCEYCFRNMDFETLKVLKTGFDAFTAHRPWCSWVMDNTMTSPKCPKGYLLATAELLANKMEPNTTTRDLIGLL
ncbi:unnamed protein product [Notodromas monacha]|uniref:C3HC-type domain-containing protein n=1 Tax=Notodromas monacha TaxID=399045 RepID=A0A7R9BUG8_9CRUS|nr:unnamed protein product [Notodromas monacha]CAG0921984.1 unnamed protein product [Notodromas monacha]